VQFHRWKSDEKNKTTDYRCDQSNFLIRQVQISAVRFGTPDSLTSDPSAEALGYFQTSAARTFCIIDSSDVRVDNQLQMK
jgi:hypothetical protein